MLRKSMMRAAVHAATAFFILSRPAGAVPLIPGNSITVGRATILLETCFEGLGACSGQFVAAPGPGVGFVVQGVDGAPLLAPAMTGVAIDANFVVTTPTAILKGVTLSASGEAFGTGSAGASEMITDAVGTLIGSGSVAAGGASDVITFGTTESEIVISKRMFANSSFSGSAILVSVTQVINGAAVPEPAGVTLLVVGLLSLAAVRRNAGDRT